MDHYPTKTNCFMHAFDCLHELGGHLTIGMSSRENANGTPWPWQHLGHFDNQTNQYKSFVPPGDLDNHWKSFFGFEGAVVLGDPKFRRPMPVHLMYRGVVALFVALTIWWLKRCWDRFWRSNK